jgi:GNAT superfamily N-acetyltransferase
MPVTPVPVPNDIEIEPAQAQEAAAIDDLWRRCGERVRFDVPPAGQIVARDPGSGRVIGVAEYFRAFPPEDVLASVCVEEPYRGQGVGARLLRALGKLARRDGRRQLCGFLAGKNLAALRLLRSSGQDVHLHAVGDGFFAEIIC